MKQIVFIIPVVLSIFFAGSCTKVIDVNLDNTEPRMVIEGSITDSAMPHVIKVSQTIDIDKNNGFHGVSGASVTIYDNMDNSEVLTETAPGIYQSSTMVGVPGRTYTLTVTVNGKEYIAKSTMPAKVPFDSLGLKPLEMPDTTYMVPTVYYKDPVGIGGYYRAVQYINGERDNGMYIESDEFIDGKSREAILFGGKEKELETGDVVTVEMHCMDKATYEYLEQLLEVGGNSEVAAPANPKSNISNGALGYFSAHTISTRTLIYP